MVSSSSKSSVTSAPSCTVRRFLCSMTRARNALRSRAYASRDSRLSRVIMALLDGGLDLRKGARHLAARLHRHAELARDLRERKDAAHHGAPRRQLDQRLAVDLALEVDHRLERYPVVVPAPGVEFGVAACPQLHVTVAPHHAQQIPDLLLAPVIGAGALARAPHPLLGYLIAQPLPGAPQDAHMRAYQADLFLELAVHGFQGGLAVLDATLRELPRVLVDALAPEHLVPGIGEDDADVRTVAFLVEHDQHRLK